MLLQMRSWWCLSVKISLSFVEARQLLRQFLEDQSKCSVWLDVILCEGDLPKREVSQ